MGIPMDLKKLNSATKYPSIPTYHPMGDRGALQDAPPVAFSGQCVAREKIDGTNARIVYIGGLYFIGSREELLFASPDLLHNPAMGIVDTVRELADRMQPRVRSVVDSLELALVVYGEVYGGNVTANSKHYTGSKAWGFRLFDVAQVPLEILQREPDQIAAWRDGGGQRFHSDAWLQAFAQDEGLALPADVWRGDASALPTSLGAASEWLAGVMPKSLAGLDDGAGGVPEGVVLRSTDRGAIAKLRFEDYRRTLKRAK